MTKQGTSPTVDDLADANSFETAGPIRLNYSSTSINGLPRLSYQDAEVDLSFEGDEISRVNTVIGEQVTVTLENVPDAFIRRFTLIVPTIRLAQRGEAEFDTLGVETTDRSGAFIPPPGPEGVLQDYRVHQLHGSARTLAF